MTELKMETKDIPKFCNEIQYVVHRIQLTKKRTNAILTAITKDLKHVVPKNYSLQVHGSFLSTLADVSSDVDFALSSANESSQNGSSILEKVRISLIQSKAFPSVGCIIDTNSLQLLEAKYLFISCGTKVQKEIQCDISYQKDTLCVYNSILMKYYVGLDGHVKPLVLFLKYLLKKYKLHGSNMFTTLVIFWLVVFLMQKFGLPSVKEVSGKAKVKKFVFGLDCSVPEDYSKLRQRNIRPSGLFLWLKTFFKMYKDYKFSEFVISPYLGKEYSVEDQSRGDTREAAAMDIEAPFKRTGNFSKRIQSNIVKRFQMVCKILYEILADNENAEASNSMFKIFPNEITNDEEAKMDYAWKHPKEYVHYLKKIT